MTTRFKANLVLSAALWAVCSSMQVALATPEAGAGEQASVRPASSLILALNPQPEPPGFWDARHNRLIPLSLLPPGPCRTKTYFYKNLALCEAHLLTKPQGT